ncbi:hypothetical protein OZX56_05235 [Lactobacillus sp. ESL0684]|uniref:phage tail assembly chaperone n=1 Tax=Lactobacillus sp. ESL0684 TaxID=2983213 RepID=UPI0023F6E5C1|nr:hypothetical protein [Lactobacillus sp. ESL0684]WEV42953.1 hypothetical protein OZX56_05235 [Lactobacillus sp. ESL0684]
MTETVKDFLMENVENPIKKENVKFKRFKSPFKIKSLLADDVTKLRNQATRQVLNSKTHQYEAQTDQNKFTDLIVEASVTSPDLHNADLMKSYGVVDGDAAKLLQRMLTIGEYNELSERVIKISGIGQEDAEEVKKTAKN